MSAALRTCSWNTFSVILGLPFLSRETRVISWSHHFGKTRLETTFAGDFCRQSTYEGLKRLASFRPLTSVTRVRFPLGPPRKTAICRCLLHVLLFSWSH